MWTALPLPTCIHKLFQSLARLSPFALEVLDGLHHEVPDSDPENDKDDEDYVPGEDYKNNDGDDDYGVRDNYIDPQQEPSNIDAYDDDNAAIILNPAGPDHDNPIAGVATDQYQTVVETYTAGVETSDTKTTGVAQPKGVTHPTGVAAPTEEDSDQ